MRWLGCVALLGMACGSDATNEADSAPTDVASETNDVSPFGGDLTAQRDPDGAIVLKRRAELLTAIRPENIQVGIVPDPAMRDAWNWDPWWLIANDSLSELAEKPPLDFMTLAASGLHVDVTLEQVADDRFHIRVVPDAEAATHIVYLRVGLNVTADEAFYGSGNRHRDIELRGAKLPMQLEPDLALEHAYNERHVPVPLVLSTRGWAVFSQSDRPQTFDVAATDPGLLIITVGVAEAAAGGLDLWLFGAEHPLDLLKPYYETTGYPRVPPEWGFGPWYWRDEIAGQAAVLDDFVKIRELNLPASAYWIDRPYASAVNSFDFAPADYADPVAMFSAAREAGLRMALWHTPYAGPETGAIYQTIVDNGWFPPVQGLKLNKFDSAPLDLTNADAVDYWQTQIAKYSALGVEGYKLDFAEDIAAGLPGQRVNIWEFDDGSDERTMAHHYPGLYHQTYRDALADADGGGFILARAGKWGGQGRVDTIWPGDLDADFAQHRDDGRVGGIPAALAYGLSLAASGYPFFAADTGGYTHGPPDSEAYRRWFEMTAVTCVMEVGGSDNQVPWEAEQFGWDPTLLDDFRRYASLHIRLFPYARALADDIAESGRSPLRPFGWAHPEADMHPDDAYFFGDDLLVAPVVAQGATSRMVPFPEGRWVDWWDGSEREVPFATELEVAAPLGRLPLFMKEGGIVPLLAPDVQTLAPADGSKVSGELWVRIVPQQGATHSLRLGDGTTLTVDWAHDLVLSAKRGSRWGPRIVWEVLGGGTITQHELVLESNEGSITVEP